MGKEKECKCCHEWWFDSDIKNDLCPNCYDYFKQLKQKLKEKDNLIEFGREEIRKRNKRIDEIVERDKKLFDDKNKELEKLKQQLAEKQNTIDEINKEFVQAVHDWKALCAEKDKKLQEVMSNIVGLVRGGELILLDKVERFIDSEIEIPNDIGAIKLTQFFEEEIQRIKTGETYINWKQSQIQLAIQKLEEVKDWLNEPFDEDGCFKIGGDLIDFIDNQIKELKGE